MGDDRTLEQFLSLATRRYNELLAGLGEGRFGAAMLAGLGGSDLTAWARGFAQGVPGSSRFSLTLPSPKQDSPVAYDAVRGRSAADLRIIRLQAHLCDQRLGQRIPGVTEAVCDGEVIVARRRHELHLDPVQPETGRVFE